MRKLAWAVLLLLVGSAQAADTTLNVSEELLSSARLWTGKKRDDFAMLALQKLLRIDPGQADALLMLGEIELRMEHLPQAEKILQQLQTNQPDHPAARQLSEAYRVATTGKKTMAMIRLLARSGKDAEAAELLRQLFPQGNPGGELGQEYALIMDKTSNQSNNQSFAPSSNQPTVASKASRFWALLNAADVAIKNNQLAKAEKLAKSANRLFHDDPEALLVIANIEHQQGKREAAENRYRHVLEAKPDEDRALRGLLRLWSANGQREQALNFVEQFVDRHPASLDAFAQLWATLLREQADTMLLANQPEQALNVLETGTARLPAQVWLRYDLASLHKRQGAPEYGRKLMAEGISLMPGDSEMAYANAIYLSTLGDDQAALASLQSIPADSLTDNMRALALKSEVRLRMQRAHVDFLGGKPEEGNMELDDAEFQARSNPDLAWEVADAWLENGEVERALVAAQRLYKPGEVESTAHYAQILYRAKREHQLETLLSTIPEASITDAKLRADIVDLRRRHILRKAAALTAEQRYADARQILEQGRSGALRQDRQLLLAIADNLEQQGDLVAALTLYQPLAGQYRDNYEARLGTVRCHIQLQDQNAETNRQQLRELETNVPLTENWLRMGIAGQYSLLDDHQEARRIAESVAAANFKDAELQMQAGRIAKSAERYEWALQHFNTARDIGLGKNDANFDPKTADAAIDGIKNRRYGFATGGFDQRHLSGTSGISRVSNEEYPLLVRWPDGYRGHFFTQLDYSNISAGNLHLADYDTSALFGKIQAYGRNHLTGLSDQTASGLDFGIGYETDDWRYDLGSSPQGYPVSYLVGGIKHTGNIGDGYYMVDVSRRPMTNSLLSYAGARDPITGEIWGGVRKNGIEFYSGYEPIKRLGLFLQGSAHYLDGEKVKSNTAIMGRTGGDWAWIDNSEMRLTTGVALMYLSYDNDQQHYTFGHGGYWSPQDYKSISFPVQWTGRYQRLSYLFRGSPSFSISQQDGAEFYPTNSRLQSQAATQALPQGYDAPVYRAGNSTAFGYTLTGMLEYKVTEQWYLGARMELARSPFYTPDFMTFYFRYDFDPSNKAIPFPPRPVKPYDRY